MPKAISIIRMQNGRPAAMAMVCSALRPPASSSTEATTPSIVAQNTRCQVGVWMAPPAAMESITSEPESEEVTKKVTISSTARIEVSVVQGNSSNSLNSATAWSACTSWISVLYPSTMIRCRAVSPNTENQKKVNMVGTIITPKTNWRIVRPRLILAMNRPTNGDQEIVQPKMNSVQLPIQSLRL